MHDPLITGIGVGLTRDHAGSARPDAPVVPHRERRTHQPLVRTRAVLAAGLHRTAHWVEPCGATVTAR